MKQTRSLVSFLAIASSAQLMAANITWDGGGDGVTLNLNTNWAGDVLPSGATPDTAVFDGTAAGVLSLNYTTTPAIGTAPGINISLAGTQTSAVSIDSGANTTSLRLNNVTVDSGAGALTLGNGADIFNLTLGNAVNQTHTWTNNSLNAATVNSDVKFGLGGAGDHALSFAGSGNWSVGAAIAPSNAARISLTKFGTGELTLSGGATLDNDGTIASLTPYGGQFAALLHGGTTRITAGTYTVSSAEEIVVGGLDVAGTSTQLIMDGGSLTASGGWVSVARGNGTGGAVSSNLTLNNSASISTGNLGGGFNAGNASTAPKGTITLNNTSSVSVANTVNIAESANSNITLNVNGTSTFSQTSASAGDTRVGLNNGATGTINVGGGTASFERDLILGYANAGSGKLVINSGTVNVASTVERWLVINRANTASGQIDLNGGTLNLNTNTDIRFSTTGTSAGTSVVNLNSGAITGYVGNQTGGFSATSLVDLQYSGTAAANNSFNLNGGTLTIGQVITSSNAGTAAFNFNGGTLKAAAASANFVDLGGANQKAYVKNGGAVIDSNGFNVTIVDPLQNGGTGGLAKQGGGTLTLAANALYSGATTVSQGTLNVVGLSATSGVSVAAGATLQGQGSIGGTTTLNGATLTNSNAAAPLSLGGLVMGAGGNVINLTMNGSAGVTVSGSITTGGFSSTINASNTAWANGLNNLVTASGFSGSIGDFSMGALTGLSGRQTAGSLQLNGNNIALNVLGDNALWTGLNGGIWQQYAQGSPTSGTPAWKLQSGGTNTDFWVSDNAVFDDSATGTTTATIQGGDITAASVTFSNSASNYTLASGDGSKIAAGNLIKNGSGDLAINLANTFAGGTTLNGGTLTLGNASALGTGSVLVNGGTLNLNGQNIGNAIVMGGGSLAGVSSLSGVISGTSFTKSDGGTLTLSNAANTVDNINVNAGTLSISNNGSLGDVMNTLNGGTLETTNLAALVIARPVTIGAGGGTLSIVGSAVAGQGSRVIMNAANMLQGSGNLTISGNGALATDGGQGVLVVTGSNTYSGNVNLVNGGMFEYDNASAVAPAATFTLGNNSEISATNGKTVGNAITVNGTGAVLSFNNSGAGVFSGAVTLNSDVNVALRNWWNYSAAQNGTISGVISGSGGIATNRGISTGTPSLTLTGVNTYTGATTIAAGTTLTLGAAGQLGAGSYAANISNNGTLNQNSSASQTYSGTISGSGALSQTGSGTTTLTGNNGYTGATTISAGKLVVNGNISTSVLTTVSGTGTLGGSGVVGDLAVTAGGTVAPGNSPGILDAGNTSFGAESTLAIEINGDTVGSGYDQLNVTGTVNLAGALAVSLGYTPVENSLFFILANDDTDAVTGTFSGLANDSWFTVGAQWFKIGYFGDSGTNSFTGGNDVVLMAVPEPAAALLGGLGLLALLRRRRS